MPLLPGEILNHRYRIVSLLADGAYGATYRAWDVKDARHYAVKEYLDSSFEIQKRFRAQANRLSQFSHPQLAAVRDHFALDGVGQYLISDYVEGVDLQSLLAQYGPLPSDLIIGWLQAACEPLSYLHKRGQLHLNIKPANIRLTPAGDIFLVDSGLPGLGVRPHADGYGAPEQQAQTDVTEHSDIYSLGATLYTMLTAVIPPNALSRESGLADLRPAREVNPDVEPYLSLVANRAMAIRADSRYETAVDFGRALNRPSGRISPLYQSGDLRRTTATQPAASPAPAPVLPPATRKQMEQRTIMALSAVLLLLIALIAGFTILNTISQPDEAEEAQATATFVSAVIAAVTDLAPSPTPLPPPTQPPTPTPAPLISEKTGARMLFMSGGLFRLGDEEGENDEQPSQMIRLNPFYIDEVEVTNAQYALCVEDNICSPPARPGATYHPAYYGDSTFDDYPVIFVNWYDAQTFCEWRDARLPSEAEWEKAAGFDPQQALKLHYPWGDAFDGTKLNFCDANCPTNKSSGEYDDGHRDTAPVGSYPDGRSPIGLYDMAGNVMEWVADWYDPRYYNGISDTNPLGPLEGEFKALRGGSWLSGQDELTVSTRSSFDPTVARANLGFRCAADAP